MNPTGSGLAEEVQQIIAEIKVDLKLDKSSIATEIARIPELHIKYWELFLREKLRLKKMKAEFSKLTISRRDYYLGKASEQEYKQKPLDRTVMKGDIELYLDADEVLLPKAMQMAIQQEKVDLIERTLKSLDSRGYNIKSIIDWMKFEMGGNRPS